MGRGVSFLFPLAASVYEGVSLSAVMPESHYRRRFLEEVYALLGGRQPGDSMKISRKIQRHVELIIRHAMAVGGLSEPVVSAREPQAKPQAEASK
jgi:hypothetical protein